MVSAAEGSLKGHASSLVVAFVDAVHFACCCHEPHLWMPHTLCVITMSCVSILSTWVRHLPMRLGMPSAVGLNNKWENGKFVIYTT